MSIDEMCAYSGVIGSVCIVLVLFDMLVSV